MPDTPTRYRIKDSEAFIIDFDFIHNLRRAWRQNCLDRSNSVAFWENMAILMDIPEASPRFWRDRYEALMKAHKHNILGAKYKSGLGTGSTQFADYLALVDEVYSLYKNEPITGGELEEESGSQSQSQSLSLIDSQSQPQSQSQSQGMSEEAKASASGKLNHFQIFTYLFAV